MKAQKNMMINAVLLFTIAAIIEMTLHECAHFVMAILVHAKDISLHHNYVNYNDEIMSLNNRIYIASAGPIFSLFFGLFFHLIIKLQKSRNYLLLLNTYFSIHGYIGFFGYLLIAPLSTSGDTGFIFDALGFPMLIVVIIAIIGFLCLMYLLKILMKYIIVLASEEVESDFEKRKKFADAVIKYPIYFGVILTMLLNLPVPVWLSLTAPFSAFSLFVGYGRILKRQYPKQDYNLNYDSLNKIKPAIILGFIIIVIINRLLVNGILIH